MFVQNELDKLSSFEAGCPYYLETVLRVIEDEAWNPLRLPPMLNDQTGALFQGCSFQSSALGNGAAGHDSDTNAESRVRISSDHASSFQYPFVRQAR